MREKGGYGGIVGWMWGNRGEMEKSRTIRFHNTIEEILL